jgi:hypothetical protein
MEILLGTNAECHRNFSHGIIHTIYWIFILRNFSYGKFFKLLRRDYDPSFLRVGYLGIQTLHFEKKSRKKKKLKDISKSPQLEDIFSRSISSFVCRTLYLLFLKSFYMYSIICRYVYIFIYIYIYIYIYVTCSRLEQTLSQISKI